MKTGDDRNALEEPGSRSITAMACVWSIVGTIPTESLYIMAPGTRKFKGLCTRCVLLSEAHLETDTPTPRFASPLQDHWPIL
jgi:hypothetical protein